MTLSGRSLRDLHWSQREKKVARATFDAAVARECVAIRKKVEEMLRSTDEPEQIWHVHQFLSEKQNEIGRKYDFRYSVLIGVFGRLLFEGWITESDLTELNEEKRAAITSIADMHRESDAQPTVPADGLASRARR